MESKNALGIYITSDKAAILCADLSTSAVIDYFEVSIESSEEADMTVLADLIAAGCTDRNLQFSEVALAMDCSMFMQHNIHTRFKDPKQIASTVRFDTEEALATDVSNTAIAFEIASTSEEGSQLTVFTAEHNLLSQIIISLQRNNIDPVAIEPDVSCLSKIIRRKISASQDSKTLFCMLSGQKCYLIAPPADPAEAGMFMRSFLIGDRQDRPELLEKQLSLTLAVTADDINCIRIFDSNDSPDYHWLGEKNRIKTEKLVLADLLNIQQQTIDDCKNPVDLAIAFSAAISCAQKTRDVNFRNDFMPFEGKKIRFRKTVKILSICFTICFLAAGFYFQWRLLTESMLPTRQLQKKFASEYSIVMPGKKMPTRSSPVKALNKELRRIKDIKSGRLSATGEKSIASKLVLVLKAFNQCAAETKLQIDKLTITAKTMNVDGSTLSTSSRKNTIKLRQAISKNQLKISYQTLESKGGRDNFRMIPEPQRTKR